MNHATLAAGESKVERMEPSETLTFDLDRQVREGDEEMMQGTLAMCCQSVSYT